MDKEVLKQKIDMFIQENNIKMLSKDPTESYQKLLQKAVQKLEDLVEKNTRKYLLNIKPRINAHIKTHTENKPIRLVIDNTQAPSYKIAKFLNKRIDKSTQYIHHIEFT
jgi:hypothetical protein